MKISLALIFSFLLLIFVAANASADDSSGDDLLNNAQSSPDGGSSSTTNSGSILDYLNIVSSCSSVPPAQSCGDVSSGIFSSIACQVMQAFISGTIPIYCSIVANPDFLRAVDAAMMLYVIFLGISFMFGLVPMKTGTLMVKLIKAVLVYSIVVNSDLYFSLVYNTVIRTPQDVVQILLNSETGTGSGTGAQNFFQYVDQGLGKVLQEVFHSQADPNSGNSYGKANLKILAIGTAIWQLGGDHIGQIFFSVVIGWIMSYFSIMVRYLLAMMSLMFILMLGPFFIPTILFEQTKYLFEEWLYMILNFIMQIVLVVGFILMVQGFFIDFYDMIKNGLNSEAMPSGSQQHLVDFDNNNAISNGSYRVAATNNVATTQASEQYFTQVFGGNSQQKLPQMVFKLIEMMIIIMCSIAFAAYTADLGALLVGRARFIRIFQGENFNFSRDREFQADLFRQNTKNGPDDALSSIRDTAQASGGR